MCENNVLKGLEDLIGVVNATDYKIYENNAHHTVLTAETQKIIAETKYMKSTIDEMEKEHRILENLRQVESSIEIQHRSIEVSQRSLFNQKLLVDAALKENENFKLRFTRNLTEFRKLYDEKRSKYENKSPLFKILQHFETNVAKLKIKNMCLEQNILDYQRIHRQFHEIQKLKFQQTIVEFSQLYVDHKNAEEVSKSLQVLKEREKELLMEHMALQDESKRRNIIKNSKRHILSTSTNEPSPVANKSRKQEKPPQEENEGPHRLSQLFPKSLQEFMKREKTVTQVPHFNNEQNKVRILDNTKIADAKKIEVKIATTESITENRKETPFKIPTSSQKTELSQENIQKKSITHQEVLSKYFSSKGIVNAAMKNQGRKLSQEAKVSQRFGSSSQEENPIVGYQSSILKRPLSQETALMVKQVTFMEAAKPTFLESSSQKCSQIIPPAKDGSIFQFSSQEQTETIFETFSKSNVSQILPPQSPEDISENNMINCSEIPENVSVEFSALENTTGQTENFDSPDFLVPFSSDLNFTIEQPESNNTPAFSKFSFGPTNKNNLFDMM